MTGIATGNGCHDSYVDWKYKQGSHRYLLRSINGFVTVLLDEFCRPLLIHLDMLMNVVVSTETELVRVADVRIAMHLHQEQQPTGNDQRVV